MPGTPVTFPFDAVSGSPSYSASVMRDVINNIVGNGYVGGVASGLAVAASSPAAMTVEVQPGAAFVQGALYSLAAGGGNVTLAVPSNSSGSTRYDRVVLKLDLTASPNVLTAVYKQGTASPPSLTQTSTVWEISLAQITVANGASSIVAANIADERGDASLCGLSVVRSAPSITYNPAIPFNLAPSSTQTFLRKTNGTFAPASGKQWWVYAVSFNTTSAGQVVTIGGYNFVEMQQLVTAPMTVLLDSYVLVESSTNIVIPNNVTVLMIERDSDLTRTGVAISFTGSGTTYSLSASNRLVVQSLYVKEAGFTAAYVYDNTLGSTLPLVSARTITNTESNVLRSNTTKEVQFPHLQMPVIIPGGSGGRTIKASATTYPVNIFGYTENSLDVAAT